MDQRERIADSGEAIRSMFDDMLANAWTSLPCIVQSFNAAKGTIVAQPAIKSRVRQQNGDTQLVTLPLLVDVPVVFPAGGGFLITFPITAGDECLVVFADRCIDTWFQQGGTQTPSEIRTHDLSDGFAIVGPFSAPRVPASINATALELRTTDRSAYIQLTASGQVNIVAPGGVHITGTTTGSGEGTFNSHTVSAHVHGGVTPGGGNTGTPIG